MADDTSSETNDPKQARTFWDRHAKLSILLIAGVFYLILIAMAATVAIILWQQR